MKYFLSFFLLASMTLFGFGCAKSNSSSAIPPLQQGWKTYQNASYGFALDYGPKMQLNDRALEMQASTYLGLPVSFFTALTDAGQGQEIESVAFFYAMNSLTKEAFIQALISSDPEYVKVLETTEINQGGLALTKIVSSTANGEKKNHYLYFKDGTTVIISQFLLQDDVFNSVFKTLRKNM